MVADLQGAALAAQQREIQLTGRCRELEGELNRLKDWDAERARYTLKTLPGGAVVYFQGPDVDSPEAPHWLCSHCFENREKSYVLPGKVRNPWSVRGGALGATPRSRSVGS